MTDVYPEKPNSSHKLPQLTSAQLHANPSAKRFIIYQKPKLDCWDVPPEIGIAGISRIRDRNYKPTVRFFWICIVSICTGLCCWQLWLCTDRYLQENVIKNVDIIRNNRVQFPAVYMCPGFGRSLQRSLNEKTLKKCKTWDDFSCFNDPLAELGLEEFTKNLNGSLSVKDLWNSFNIPLSTLHMYQPCKVSDEECLADGTEWIVESTTFDTFWGHCLALDTVVSEEYRGPFTYFTLVINNTLYNNLKKKLLEKMKETKDKVFRSKMQLSLDRNRVGIMFSLHNEFVFGMHHIMFYYIQDVLLGFQTDVKLTKNEFKMKRRRKLKCVSDDDFRNCFNRCIERNMSTNCRMPYTTTNLKDCSVNNYLNIQVENYKAYTAFSFSSCNCPPRCTEVEYKSSVDVIDKLVNESELIRLKFYFADDSYESTTEKLEYEFSAFISDIGGNLGFFIGFCVLNVVEFLEYVAYLVYKTL